MGRSGRARQKRAHPSNRWCCWRCRCRARLGLKHRLWAQTARFVQLHPQVQAWRWLWWCRTGVSGWGRTSCRDQLEAFLAGVHWLSLEELGQKPGLDPLVSLLTLPVLPKPDIPGATGQILQPRPDLLDTVLTILGSGFPISLARKSWP